MKNIVVCCDGTQGQYDTDENNSNIIRLFERLEPDGPRQISYYDPGVGTRSPLPTKLGRKLANWVVSATGVSILGSGLRENVEEAYNYLMDFYEPEDQVFLFGYSRGAHTVRELAGVLDRCGLLTKGSDNLLPYMMEIYENEDRERSIGFKKHFSRQCTPHFIGVWDTVASVGYITRKQFSDTVLNPLIPYAYQALAVDERRYHFRPSLWDINQMPYSQTVEQVWFPGYHGDVGGQKACRAVSDISLEWMIEKAKVQGLRMREGWERELASDPASGELNLSHKWFWRLGARVRDLGENPRIHESVYQRMDAEDRSYRPPNVPARE